MESKVDTSVRRAIAYATALAALREMPITTRLLLFGIVRQQSQWKSGIVGELQLHPRQIEELFEELRPPSADIRFTLLMAAFESAGPTAPGGPPLSGAAELCLRDAVEQPAELVTSDDLLLALARQLGVSRTDSARFTFEMLEQLSAVASSERSEPARRARGLKRLMRRPVVGQRRVPYFGCMDERLRSSFVQAWRSGRSGEVRRTVAAGTLRRPFSSSQFLTPVLLLAYSTH